MNATAEFQPTEKKVYKIIRGCPHSPYSPDLALCDFWGFSKVKTITKGTQFESIKDTEEATTKDIYKRGL